MSDISDWARQYYQHWPTPTMSQADVEACRGCPDASPYCKCCGFCPVRLAREERARQHDHRKRDWRHRRWT